MSRPKASVVQESRWMILVHQIPHRPAYLRVKVGRQLQRIGAVAIKNSVYALPRNEETQEDLQWVLREIEKGGGEGAVLEARFVDGRSDDEVTALFQAAREKDYAGLAEEARRVARSLPRRGVPDNRKAEAAGQIARLRRRLGEIADIDFFGAPGREKAEGLVAGLEARMNPQTGKAERTTPTIAAADYQGRIWVTRAGIKVDRMASAWLIRKFIDPGARFKFVPAKGYRPEPGEVRFDMFEAEFTHEGDGCTFETLVTRFGLAQPGLHPLAEIVHDIDMKDGKYGRDEAAGIGQLIAGIAASHPDDETRLERGAALFDDLFALHEGGDKASRRPS